MISFELFGMDLCARVSTYKLLEDHDPDTNRNTLQHVHLKHWLPGAEAAVLGKLRLDLIIEHNCSLDLQELCLQYGVLGCKPPEL